MMTHSAEWADRSSAIGSGDQKIPVREDAFPVDGRFVPRCYGLPVTASIGGRGQEKQLPHPRLPFDP